MRFDGRARSVFRVTVFAGLAVLMGVSVAVAELPESLYSKGGIIYPRTGDSTQEIFRTPPNVGEFLQPGMLIGVLPEDCSSAKHGELGSVYRCPYGLLLKAEEKYGATVYRVIEVQ